MHRDLFITLDFPPSLGGVARYYGMVIKYLKRPVTVLAPKTTMPFAHDTADLRVHRRHLLGPGWLPLLFHSLIRVLIDRPQLIHVGQVLPVGTVALILKKCFGVPYVVYTHGLDLLLAERHPRRRMVTKKVLAGALLVIANSSDTQQRLSAFQIPSEKSLVLLPGSSFSIDMVTPERVAQLRSKFGIVGKQVLLTVARLVKRKGIHHSLTAFADLADAYPNVRYVIAGEGEERNALEKQARECGVADRVIFTGGISEEDLAALYSLSSIFVLTPTTLRDHDVEGFGIVFLEAGTFEKPVVGTRVGGIPEAIQDGVTGLCVPPDDPQALVRALKRLLDEPAYAADLGRKGREYVMREGQWGERIRPLALFLQKTFPL